MKKRTTIFRQLIFNVVFPAVIALIVLAILNYQNVRGLLTQSFEEKNFIITDYITKVLEFQGQSFKILDEVLNPELIAWSNQLAESRFRNTTDIENADLLAIRSSLGMDPSYMDIYIIDSEGTIVNTTFPDDLGLNIFSLGEEHRNFILRVFQGGKFVSESFTIEANTRRPIKYTYQPTIDGKYIIELGIYSEEADNILNYIETAKSDITEKQSGIIDVELFFLADKPVTLNKQARFIHEHEEILLGRFLQKDSLSVTGLIDGEKQHFDYYYMEQKDTDLYKDTVIRIISDRSAERKLKRSELAKFLILFGLTTCIVMILTYRKTKLITDPIKKLVLNVNRITHGHLDERADVVGNNEITILSKQFNLMIEQLEELYNDLEAKVRERTAEIQRQKEEIEAQRDSIEEQRNILAQRNTDLKFAYDEIGEQKKHITDSIQYAKRIQNAILPPAEFVKSLIPDSFILYRPKDIVSGDFYWFARENNLIYFSVVDCTGHGVPGAFMSIVGFNQLNYALNVVKAVKPSAMLDALNEGVTSTLREKSTSNGVKDGMDIALCALDYEKMKLHFAGAYNSLYLVREGEITIIRADRHPIGASGVENVRFSGHEIEIRKGDMIYLFSDGYADQFGGPQKKKFLLSRFRELLVSVSPETIQKQEEILNTNFDQWKGQEEQVDDILIIGVRV